ncbi:unnamed protein product [Rotaria socialis]|uniref:Uncharacterized protein n=1 Tax=Rotaria socialis TaxID=392032 RepID=A0A820UHB9_9BILA|nr:unnamed protein product [Rotaria socialis]CAF4481704.1 unnamed protein product [Rotaria socialis]
MNTPEEPTMNSDINVNKQQPIDKLQAKLVQDQLQRRQGKDYGRILRECNKPPQWYQPSPTTRSIYYYAPHYQKFLQQHSAFSVNTPRITPRTRTSSRSPARSTKYDLNLHNPSNSHRQKPLASSRLQPVITLPSITTYRKKQIIS